MPGVGVDVTLASRYRLLRRTREAVAGEVWVADDQRFAHRRVDIEIFRGDLSAVPAEVERRRQVIQALQWPWFSHPNAPRIILLAEDQDVRFAVLEHVEGESLSDLLSRQGPLDPQEATRIAGEVADAIQKAHEAGVVHGDLRTKSVVVTADGSTRVLDLGLTPLAWQSWIPPKPRGDGEEGGPSPHQVPGPSRMPSLEVRRPDLFALGTLLYEMLSGRAPALIVGVSGVEAGPEKIEVVAPWVPEALATICDRALSADLGDRPPSAGSFAEALRLSVSVSPPGTAPPARPDRSRQRREARREARAARAQTKSERAARGEAERTERAGRKEADRAARKEAVRAERAARREAARAKEASEREARARREAEEQHARQEAARLAEEARVAAAEAARLAAEEERAREEAAKRAEEERRAALEAARLAAEAYEQAWREATNIAAEEQRVREEAVHLAAEEQRVREEAARLAVDEERARQEAARLEAEEERARADATRLEAEGQRAREEAVRLAAEEERARQEAARFAAQEEAAREVAARLAAEEERAREEATRLAAEEERARQDAVRLAAEEQRAWREAARREAEERRAREEVARLAAHGEGAPGDGTRQHDVSTSDEPAPSNGRRTGPWWRSGPRRPSGQSG